MYVEASLNRVIRKSLSKEDKNQPALGPELCPRIEV